MTLNIAATARVTGLIYLVLIACGVFAEFFVRSGVAVFEDPAATAAAIRENATFFRLGIVSDILCAAGFASVVCLLYALTREAAPVTALVSAGIGLVATAVFGANLATHTAALVYAEQGPALAGLPAEHADAMAYGFLRLHSLVYHAAMVLFGFHMLLVGRLIIGGRYLPFWLGIFWCVGGVGYIVGYLANITAPGILGQYARLFTTPGGLAELVMALWLLAIGVRRGSASERQPPAI